MYMDETINNFLHDLSSKQVQMGGGSIIGLNLACVCSLMEYICNLTIGKKRYINVEEKAKELLEEAEILKSQCLSSIDEDKEILEEILSFYKTRDEKKDEYEEILQRAVDFSFEVLDLAYKVLVLVENVSKIGNLMLVSDFEIGAYMAYSCIESSITNIKINIQNIEDENYIEKMKNKYLSILDDAYEIKEKILKYTNNLLK